MTDNSSSPSKILKWDAEEQYPDLCAIVRDGLREVNDPELGMNVIQLGLIRNLTIEPERAIIRMILTTPFCPYGPTMLEQVRSKAEELLQRPTHMDFGMDAWDFTMMEDGAEPRWGMFF